MKVAVYCSAKDVIPEEYLQLGDTLGTWLAQHEHTLVYGGATGGLMTRISNAVRAAGGCVIGVVPERVIRVGRLADNCNKLYKVPTMSRRKQKMKDLADCFVCLPGSYGTLDEMFDVIAGGTVGEHNKPIFILNYKEFYEGIKVEAEHMRTLNFLPQRDAYAPIFVDSIDDLYTCITNFKNKYYEPIHG